MNSKFVDNTFGIKPYRGSWPEEPKKDSRWFGINKKKDNRINK